MKLRRIAAVAAFAMASPVLSQTAQNKLPVKSADQPPVKAADQLLAKPTTALKPVKIGKKTFPPAPQKTGCFKHITGSTTWTEVPCLTPDQVARIPHPDSIGILTLQPSASSPVPITPEGGEMDVDFVALGGITDSRNGPGMFSIQLNTNGFDGNGDKPGDADWVQFTLQQFSRTVLPNNPNVLCIWSIDTTTQDFTKANCLAVTLYRGPQTGDVATIAGTVSSGQLQLGAAIPWAVGSEQFPPDGFLVTSPDYRNFGGRPWTSVNGGLLGTGKGSQASLTRSCITATPSLAYANQLVGAQFGTQLSDVTGETNNLNNSNLPIATCATDGVCSAPQHGVSPDWYNDGIKSCYPGDVAPTPLPNQNSAAATEDDSSVYTANGNHIRMCKNNTLVIGIDVDDSRFLCSATMPPAPPFTVDTSTKGIYFYPDKSGHLPLVPTLHSVHVCPGSSAMVGWDQAKDLLLCGQIPISGYVPLSQSLFGTDSVNGPGGTQVPEPNYPTRNLHACDPAGSGDPYAVAGIDVANNVLICRNSMTVPRLQ